MKNRAFTLIELLLAVVLMALTLSVIYGVVWAGVKSRQALAGETDALCRINSAIDVIQSDLRRISCATGSLRILPLGQTGGVIMEISALPPSASNLPEKVFIFLMPQSGDLASKIIRHVELDSNFAEACKTVGVTTLTSDENDDNDFEILLDNVDSFRLRCNNGEWLENSYTASAAPAVVEITASIPTDSGKIVSVTRSIVLPVQAGPIASAAEGAQ